MVQTQWYILREKLCLEVAEVRQSLLIICFHSDYIGEPVKGLITSDDMYDLKTLLDTGGGECRIGRGEHSHCLDQRPEWTVMGKMI